MSYPSKLEEALRRKLDGVALAVKAVPLPRRTAEQMVDELDKRLAEDKPDLVIWQTGTVDAMQGVDPEKFREHVEEGIGLIHTAGADVILMNMQFSPRTESIIAAGAYADNLRWVSQQHAVPLFDRLGIMRHWSDAGAFDFSATSKDPVLARQVHACLGQTLANFTVETGKLLESERTNGQ